MERRHKNINNEILMEKRVLQKLVHPNIVILYATFQDECSLYYQMEYFSNGELWALIKDTRYDETELPAMVGLPWSQIRFYILQLINVIEYMHRKGIVHRDLKPENLMMDNYGHLKV